MFSIKSEKKNCAIIIFKEIIFNTKYKSKEFEIILDNNICKIFYLFLRFKKYFFEIIYTLEKSAFISKRIIKAKSINKNTKSSIKT